MQRSVKSSASNASTVMLEQLANRSSNAWILRQQGTFNDQQMRLIWNAMGLYISRNLRMGRGVNIPKFGIFTFTPTQVRLKGVTNQKQRDLKPRVPVFLIQKQFIKGVPLKTAIFFHQQFGYGLRPYSSLGTTGDIPITKANYIQISSYANMTKDATQLGITRILKYITQKLLNHQTVNIQIPNVGQFICKNNLVAVKFNQYLYRDTRNIFSKSVQQRKVKGNMTLTTDNLKKFAHLTQMNKKLLNASDDLLQIDQRTKTYLKNDFGFYFNQNKNPFLNSLTDFGRTYASRQFDPKFNQLKNSQINKLTQNGFLTSQAKSFNKQYNMALKLLKQWVLQNCPISQNSFKAFVQLSGKKNEVMNQTDVWQACKKISLDITQQQAHQLFRLLDANRDGFLTKDDWKKNITFDTNYLVKSTVAVLKKKNIKSTAALKIMGLEGISSVDVFTLKTSLQKLNPNLNQQQALFLSRYIAKGSQTVPIQSILQMLNLAQINTGNTDTEWQQKFLERLKKKMMLKNIYQQQLQNKFRFYDKSQSGYIQQTDFKNVLAQFGLTLTLSQLLKIVRIFPINQKNHINYLSLIQKLNLTQTISNNPPITWQQFLKSIKQNILNNNKLSIKFPISIRQCTSYIQSQLFKDQQQNHLINFVKKLDLNKDQQISQDDINAFKRLTRQQINYKPQKSCQLHLQDLITKIKQRSIKKKISFYDVFNKLDSNKDGFITFQQWNKNINDILPLDDQQKQLLFQYMDISKLQMIDYKTFLNFMNGKGRSTPQSEKYDWVEQCVQKIKQWLKTSGTTIHKSFKLVDNDGDSYINQKDLQQFLIDKIKYQPRQINQVRLQKLLKILDSFKRGKVDQSDWQKLLSTKSLNWISDAKQQIGIVISRLYSSLTDAFYQITNGDQKLLFNSFKSWIQKKKILSGFLPNQDILKKIFSQLDVHKKGYLIQKDFISIFGGYNWKSQQTHQFIQKLVKKFNTVQQAYRCMNGYKNQKLNQPQFQIFVQQLFGTRFKKSDIHNIWSNLSSGNASLSLNQFQQGVGQQWKKLNRQIQKQYPKDDWKYNDYTIIKGTQIRNNQDAYHQAQATQTQVRKIVKTIKQLVYTSPKSLQQAFDLVDTQKTGKLTNLQFKKACRNLNVAFTSKQLDLLLMYCDYQPNQLINWKQFIKRFNLTQDQKKVISRIQPKLQHLSDLFHFYMVSPKDAYRQFNNHRTGFMNFQQFHKMLKELYSLANESLPELSIIKELFQHIDVRRDDLLDFQQFSQNFRNCNPPSLLMGTIPAKQRKQSNKKQSIEKDKPTRQQQVPAFKHSPQYQDFVKFISRNRKFIQQKIQSQEGKDERLVPFSKMLIILNQIAETNKLKFTQTVIKNSLAFAMTGENIDYRLMLENCKTRGEDIVQFPLKKMF